MWDKIEKQATINKAQGDAAAIEAIASANAAAITKIAAAIEQPGGLQAINLKIAEEYVQSFGNIAKAGNTVVVPANLADISGLITAAMSVVKTGK